jgi:hypothetical protein
MKIDRDVLVPRERTPAALAVVDRGGPSARVPVVDGEADGFEAELAGVRAGEQRGADVEP